MDARARSRAAEVWLIRERTEHEVAAIFARLARDLSATGAPSELARRADVCSEDEKVHAVHCRNIVDALEPGRAALAPNLHIVLGTPHLTVAQRALYTSVALGCITESLSAALLLEMRSSATEAVVAAGLDRILTDEVQHSRLGWAHLAVSARRGDVSWLAVHIPAMLDAAVQGELHGTLPDADRAALRGWGILSPSEVRSIVEATRVSVIEPGLRELGVPV